MGYFKCYREWFSDPVICRDGDNDYLYTYIWLNRLATHKEIMMSFGSSEIMLQPGQLITGQEKLAERVGVTRRKMRTILEWFVSGQQIAIQTTSQGTLISLLNWSLPPTKRQQNATNKNNKKNKKIYSCLPYTQSKLFNKAGGREQKKTGIPTLEEVMRYCLERKNTIDPQGFVDYYASSDWMIRGEPVRDWKALVRRWEAREKRQPAPNRFHNFEQRGYDYEALENKLLNG